MALKQLDSPSELLRYMNETISWGFIHNDAIIDKMDNFKQLYTSFTIDKVFDYGVGTCIEQVELARNALYEQGYIPYSFCIRSSSNPENNRVHCFLVYSKDALWYWFEHSWEFLSDIHVFNSLDALLNKVAYYFYYKERKTKKITSLELSEYDKMITGINYRELNEMMDYHQLKSEIITDARGHYALIKRRGSKDPLRVRI